MILAAGFGTRLQPLTNTIPKPLIPIAGVPNIVRVIQHLKQYGITDIVINLHHLPEPIEAYLGNGERLNVNIAYSRESQILGTGGGIKQARDLLNNERFIVVNGDVLFAPNINEMVARHEATGALATMVLRPDPNAEKIGAVGIDASRKVRRLVWTGDKKDCTSTYMFTGVHILEPEIFDLLPDNGCIVTKTYMPLVESKGPLYGSVSEHYFCDLGTPARYLEATSDLLCGNVKLNGFTPPEDGIHCGKNVSIDPSATLKPGTALCDDVTICGNVTIENVIAMPGATISASSKNAIHCLDGTVISKD